MQTRSPGWVRRFGVGLAVVAIVGAAVATQVDASSSNVPPAPGAGGRHAPHIMPFGLTPPASGPKSGPKGGVPAVGLPGLDTAGSAPSGAHLVYNGGRVVSNAQIVQVIWGTGTYEAHTTSTATPSVSSFFNALDNSNYSSWLDSEYNTVTSSFNGTKTNQHIGRGTFAGQVTITPSAGANGSTVDDTAIQPELVAQINAGHLPAPTHDALGNDNTIYALFFRHGQTITQGGSSSLVAGGFCAYHGTIAGAGSVGEIYYTVEPDLTGVSGCGTGNDFQNTTSVMSHELTETITDAEVGIAGNGNGPPLAWYDNTNGEIGDICNAQQGTFTGADGQSYMMQFEFSNAQNNCLMTPTSNVTATNDFSIAASPATVSVTAGGSTSSTIGTAVTAGAAQTVSLSVSGAPAGVTATLSPTSVTSGQSATLNIATTSSAAAGNVTLTITGTATSGSHSTTLAVTISSGTSGGGGSSITNGGFETGTLSGWTASGASETTVSSGCHGGTYCAQLGGTSPTNGDSTISQTFTAPSGATGISLWYKMTCPDTVTYDWALATLKDNTSGATATLISKTCVTNAWTNVTGNLAAGHSYTLTLTSHDDNYAGDPTFTLYDDVALVSGGTTGSGLTNGGFESGTSGWTTAGTTSITTSGCHGGVECAMAGGTSPTNGDSSFGQTFTAPTGTSSLSFWYKMTCPDTVTYDWATATLKDNTSGATTTVLAKTCTTNAWTQVTATVTAGHSYTLTLTSHDDNYAGDPTYTLFDDVAVR